MLCIVTDYTLIYTSQLIAIFAACIEFLVLIDPQKHFK